MKAVFCIPTYNHFDIMRDFIDDYAKFFLQKIWDIVIYDSSENEDIEQYLHNKSGLLNNIIVKRKPCTMSSGEKIIDIYSDYSNDERYDYVWMCGDGVRYTEKAIKSVEQYMELKYDLIHINSIGVTKEYSDRNEYLREMGWHATLFGATIWKRDSLLRDFNADLFKTKYCRPDNENYSHVSILFNQLSKLYKYRIIYLAMGKENVGSSIYKIKSDWENSFFFIVFESWINTVKALPYSEEDKTKCIRDLLAKAVLPSEEKLLYLRSIGSFNLSVLSKYKDIWKQISDITIEKATEIANIPSVEAKKMFDVNYGLEQLEIFMNCTNNIYIYGHGIIGNRFYDFFTEIGGKIEGFCVSDNHVDNNKKDISIQSIIENDKEAKFIVALSSKNAREVIDNMTKMGLDENRYFYHIGVRDFINKKYSSLI